MTTLERLASKCLASYSGSVGDEVARGGVVHRVYVHFSTREEADAFQYLVASLALNEMTQTNCGMTELEKAALGTVALSKETVQSFYDGSHSGTAEQCLKALCRSHERLRAEIEGAEILLKEQQEEAAKIGQQSIDAFIESQAFENENDDDE